MSKLSYSEDDLLLERLEEVLDELLLVSKKASSILKHIRRDDKPPLERADVDVEEVLHWGC
jgi:hypothetical protein